MYIYDDIYMRIVTVDNFKHDCRDSISVKFETMKIYVRINYCVIYCDTYYKNVFSKKIRHAINHGVFR